MNRLQVLLALLLLFDLTQVGHAQTAPIPRCADSANLALLGTDSIAPGPDGKKHIKYRFINGSGQATPPPQAIQNAFVGGLNQWNAQSAATGVVFEAAAPGAHAHVEFKYTSNNSQSSGCAAFNFDTDRIYYGPAFTTRATTDPSGAASVIAHELGHSLGLGDEGVVPLQPTVMNNATSCTSTLVTGTVQPRDAARVGPCLAQAAAAQPNPGGGAPGGIVQAVPTAQGCIAYYVVTTTYSCTARRCTYLGETWEYVNTICD